ncbi:MAG: amidohydrolase [Desulfohalobiaceae bacterium]|nr:amidohydrolase [Desulfohalobiaceae bacterium]
MGNTRSRLDLSALPVLDQHCHLFATDYKQHDISALLNMSLNDMPSGDLRQTMIFRKFLLELRSLLQLPEATEDSLLLKRQERMEENYSRWIRDLFSDCSLETMLVDLGYKPADQDLEQFERLVPVRIHYLFRIESVLDDLWKQFQNREIDLAFVEEHFDAVLDDNLAQTNIVGFKTIIGYRTGLQVQPATRSQLLKVPPDEKQFRDYFFLRLLSKTSETGMPVQIHAAFGESNIDIQKNSPALLKWVFDQESFRKTPVILVHGGYPRCFEAGYLASVYPNVYVDLSEMIPFVPLGLQQGLRDIFDMCPFTKILYGSDGFIVPEIHWMGARMAKEALTALFEELIDIGLFDASYAMNVARMILSENARALYRLDSTESSSNF